MTPGAAIEGMIRRIIREELDAAALRLRQDLEAQSSNALRFTIDPMDLPPIGHFGAWPVTPKPDVTTGEAA